jgi:hypothetical protein
MKHFSPAAAMRFVPKYVLTEQMVVVLGPFGPTEPEPRDCLQVCYPYSTEVRLTLISSRIKPDLFTMCHDYRSIYTRFS